MYDDFFKMAEDKAREYEEYQKAKTDEKKKREEEYLRYQRQQGEKEAYIQKDIEEKTERIVAGYEEFKKEAHVNGMMRGLWKGLNAFKNYKK